MTRSVSPCREMARALRGCWDSCRRLSSVSWLAAQSSSSWRTVSDAARRLCHRWLPMSTSSPALSSSKMRIAIFFSRKVSKVQHHPIRAV